jgi:hypothetical protein
MSERLLALIEKARHVRLTPEEEREQEIGFAFGNVHYENSRVTRELVERSIPAAASSESSATRGQ